MQWYTFSEGQRRRPAPDFRLPSGRGGSAALDDYRGQRNLVLFFTHDGECSPCQALLRDLAARHTEYQSEDAQVVAIVPEARSNVAEMQSSLDLPFPLLADPDNQVRRGYLELIPDRSETIDVVFVMDRYGAPYAAVLGPEPGDPAVHEEILEWLGFIEIQCPECGISEWPVEA